MRVQCNLLGKKMSFLHKVLSRVVDYSLDFDLLQYQYHRRLLKTITGGINFSKASGCNPNTALQQKSFSATYWQWQHLYLLDAVPQSGYRSFLVMIGPCEWTFPWPPFILDIKEDQCIEPTDLLVLKTLHIAGDLASAHVGPGEGLVSHPGQLVSHFDPLEQCQ